MIRLSNIERLFAHGGNEDLLLRRIDLDIQQGEFVPSMGPSGAGKSTYFTSSACMTSPGAGNTISTTWPSTRLITENAPTCAIATLALSFKAITARRPDCL